MSKALVITLLAIVIIVLGATAVYITQRQEGEKVKEQPVGTIPKAPEIDISDWKTYRNEKYGFEIKYPKTWIETWVGPSGSTPEEIGFGKDDIFYRMGIVVTSGSEFQKGKNLWEFANAGWQGLEYFTGVNECKWTKTNFGVSGVRCTYIFEGFEPEPFIISPPEVFFETNPPSEKKVVIVLSASAVSNPKPDFDPEIFDAVVKTFKYVSR